VLSAAEPTIAEESEDNEEVCATFSQISEEESGALQADACLSDFDEMDDAEICEFDDEVCSIASENPDGVEEIDDMLVATKFAQVVVSDDMIRDALVFQDFPQQTQAEADDDACNLCTILNYARDILGGAQDEDTFVSDSEDECEECVEFLGEGSFCDEDLAFDYTSCILDGAIVQATTTWEKQQEEAASSPSVPSTHAVQNERSLEDIKAEARRVMLKAAMDKSHLASPMVDTPTVTDMECLKQRARECLLKAARVVAKSPASDMNQVREEDEPEDLRRKVQGALVKAATSGELERALGQVAQNIPDAEPAACDEAATLNFKALRQILVEATASGKLQAALREVAQKEEAEAVSFLAAAKDRTLHSSRSRRRIIGGVVRQPATFSMDIGMEPSGEDDSTSGRASSLTRSYDTLGVQFHSLTDGDELPCTVKASSSARKPSKARAKLQAASMSAMSMDLSEVSSSASSPAPASMYSFDHFASSLRGSFPPSPLKVDQKMRPSSSLGSLNLDQTGLSSFAKAKNAPGGMLPSLTHGKNSAESIAWSMQVSKTQSKWRNTGLRGSASMIF